LIETRGMDQFLRFWQETTRYAESSAMLEDFCVSSHLDLEDSGDHLVASVQRVYGRSLPELDAEWRAWLQGQYAAP
ncbi:MAG TPA: hypothetical protein PLG21_14980, partial [Anaerolineae bacterium]|nr:hypothetical protein [Anaerolineae bacterium]